MIEPSPLTDPSDDPGARFLGHGDRFSREHGFVDGGLPFDDVSVGGDLLAGLDQDPVARLELGKRNVDRGPVGLQQVGLRRHQPGQLLQGPRRPETALISSQWPRSMMSMSVASSQKKILPGRPKTTALL